MTTAVCYRCGAAKSTPFRLCTACGVEPRSVESFSKSLVLSSHLSSAAELDTAAAQLQQGGAYAFASALLRKADEALRDKQLSNMLKMEAGAGSGDVSGGLASSELPRLSVADSSLHKSPFNTIGVNVRDDRRRIIEAADERSLEVGDDICQSARALLTNPRRRLESEIAWLPGVSPRRAEQLMRDLDANAASLRSVAGLPPLAHLNLLSAAFEGMDRGVSPGALADFIDEVSALTETLDSAAVLRDINEDRAISGFVEIQSLEQVDGELAKRKRHYRNTIKDALNRLEPSSLVEIMRMVVEKATHGGQCHAPALIDDLVDGYEVDIQGFLEKESANIDALVTATRAAAGNGARAVQPLVDKLAGVAANWDRVAQPVQLSSKARGTRHDASHEVAYTIRSLAVDLWNDHQLLEQSQFLTKLVAQLFAELPEFAERVEGDADALRDIQRSREQDALEDANWARDIAFSAELGLIFKDSLRISTAGVCWKGSCYPLETITRVRWGATVHRTNGIKTGTTYTFGFGDNHSEAVGTISNAEVFEGFIAKLWRAVGVRLLGETVAALKSGRGLAFGGGTIRDDGVTLVKRKMFGANETVNCVWANVEVYSASGAFYLQAKGDKKASIGATYIDGRNTHIIEQIIRTAFKKPGMRRLSEILD